MEKTLAHPEVNLLPYPKFKIKSHLKRLRISKNKKLNETQGTRKRQKIIRNIFNSTSGSDEEIEEPGVWDDREEMMFETQKKIFEMSSISNTQMQSKDDFLKYQEAFKQKDETLNAARRRRNRIRRKKIHLLRLLKQSLQIQMKIWMSLFCILEAIDF